jgi:hypothetical protein
MHFVCLCARRYLGSELPDILNKRTHHHMRTDTCTQITLSILLAGSSRIYIRFMFIFLFINLDASALLFQVFAQIFQIRPTCPKVGRSVVGRTFGCPTTIPATSYFKFIPHTDLSICWHSTLSVRS